MLQQLDFVNEIYISWLCKQGFVSLFICFVEYLDVYTCDRSWRLVSVPGVPYLQ